VAARLMKVYISRGKLMESELYKSIFAEGEVQGEKRGEARGKARALASTLIRMLTHRLGSVDAAPRQRIPALHRR
jgi:predicted transposase YdaD